MKMKIDQFIYKKYHLLLKSENLYICFQIKYIDRINNNDL